MSELLPYLTPGKPATHATGLNPTFSSTLWRFLQAVPPQYRGQVSIYSGYRSPERQAQLYRAAIQKYGSPEAARRWVAPPGRSQHNFGMAADLRYGSKAAREWVHQNAGQFGLHFPMAHENWHVEMIGGRNRNTSAPAAPQVTAGGPPIPGNAPPAGMPAAPPAPGPVESLASAFGAFDPAPAAASPLAQMFGGAPATAVPQETPAEARNRRLQAAFAVTDAPVGYAPPF